MSKKNQLKKKLQYGSISIVLAVLFIAYIIVGNLGVTFLTDRFNLKLDMSAEGLYEISEQTEIMLKNLSEPVTAHILLSENEVENTNGYAQANELLKRYANMSGGLFTINYVDVYKNPTFIQNYETNETIGRGAIIMESSQRFKVMELYDLYEIGTSYNSSTGSTTEYISGFAADQAFASGLHYVTTKQLPNAVTVIGHGEVYDSSFLELFTSNNYTVTSINIAMEEIPANCDLLILGTPTADYTEDEINKIDAYLNDNTGNAMVFTDMEAANMPVFQRYFEEWGVAYEDAIVCDDTRAISSQAWVVPYILSTEVTEIMKYDSNSILVAPYSRQMNVLWETRDSRSTTVLLQTSDSSYAKNYATQQIASLVREENDAAGPYPIAILSTQSRYVNNERLTSNVMFFSTSAIVNSTFLAEQNMYNSKFVIAAMNQMNPVVDAVSIEARSYTDDSLVVLQETANVILIVLVIVIPLLIMALGLFVWIRRKNK